MKTGRRLLIAAICVLLAAAAALVWRTLRAREPEPEDAAAPTAESAAPAVPSPSPERTETPAPTPEPTPEPEDGDLVYITDCIPGVYVDLRYASTDNFTGRRIYDFTQPKLRYGTVKKLARVQEALLAQGYSLKIWDAYRPVSAQFRLWEVCPNSAYVANPNTGYSSHSRGNTVDVTLVRADGSAIPMPSDFDTFSAQADRDYSDVPAEAREHVRILEAAMQAEGFVGYSAEWWHFTDSTPYDVVTEG